MRCGLVTREETREEATLLLLLFVEPQSVPLAIESLTGLDAVVDRAPVGQTTEASDVYKRQEEIGLELAREARSRGVFLGEVSIDGVELHATLAAPLHGFVQ